MTEYEIRNNDGTYLGTYLDKRDAFCAAKSKGLQVWCVRPTAESMLYDFTPKQGTGE